MERDSLVSHGMGGFLHERFGVCGDEFKCHICDICGTFASRKKKRENKINSSNKDVYECIACKNSTRVSAIKIPYCFKLFVTEMMAMNILPRLRVRKNRFDSQIHED
jgi:DNA-directed RNA polymerase II subunit RPB2